MSLLAPADVPRSAPISCTTPGSDAIASFSFLPLRPGMATSTPSSANVRAIAKPIPAEPPSALSVMTYLMLQESRH